MVANQLTGGIDEFFSRTDSTGTLSPLPDALGSTIALTDSTGTLQTQYTYEPFGNTTVNGPASSNPFQYTGRENDGAGSTTTGLDTTSRSCNASSAKIRWVSREAILISTCTLTIIRST